MAGEISQEELDALVSEPDAGVSKDDALLTSFQNDILGEIGNISMGTAATSLSKLLNQKVFIDAPSVKIMSWEEISNSYDRPCMGAKIDYTVGLEGTNLLILKSSDAKIIVDLMMGGDGKVTNADEPLSEVDISAVGEAMNQMIGSSSTSLSTLINRKIDIATPKIQELDLQSNASFYKELGFEGDPVAVVVFKLTIGDLIKSDLMQVLPVDFASTLSSSMFPAGEEPNSLNPQNAIKNNENIKEPIINEAQQTNKETLYMQQDNANRNQNASLAQFQTFEQVPGLVGKENMNILMDVPLEVTVELGKTSKRIKDILEFSPGTIVELNKLAGEPIDVLVNGKYVAKGEVVVIDENFGIRITSIINPELRI